MEKLNNIPTPYFLIDESAVIRNLEILGRVKAATGCKILLAQKAFSTYSLYPLIGQYLDGTTASGLHEARLGREEMGKETHIFSPAYRPDEFGEICGICDHIVFNSFAQLNKFKLTAQSKNREIGLRVNPEVSTQSHPIYDPCAPFSRFGVKSEDFYTGCLDGVSGLHFHTLCEQNSDALKETLAGFEERFADCLKGLRWVNFGGGHHITRDDYDIEGLIALINRFKSKYGVQVYLEPGEAVVLNCGYLVSTVLDIVHNGMDIAVLDTSAACHIPDVLEMPYRPPVINGGEPNADGRATYRLSCCTCLAGDVIGDYSFPAPLSIGDTVTFSDMALYTMVKTNTFNGINLPSIILKKADGSCKTIRTFGYDDFKSRL